MGLCASRERLSICHSERRRSRSEESHALAICWCRTRRAGRIKVKSHAAEVVISPKARNDGSLLRHAAPPAPRRMGRTPRPAPLSFPAHLPPGQHKSPGQFGPGLFLQCWRRLFVVLVLAVADDHQLVVELLIHVFDDLGQLVVPHHGVAALGVQGVHPILDRGNDVRALAHHFFIL
jgi:hypothetical protein